MAEICERDTLADFASSAWVMPLARLAVRIACPSLPHELIPRIGARSDSMNTSNV